MGKGSQAVNIESKINPAHHLSPSQEWNCLLPWIKQKFRSVMCESYRCRFLNRSMHSRSRTLNASDSSRLELSASMALWTAYRLSSSSPLTCRQLFDDIDTMQRGFSVPSNTMGIIHSSWTCSRRPFDLDSSSSSWRLSLVTMKRIFR